MSATLLARMASSAEMLAVFDDEALIAHALAFEAALAEAEAECGVIPVEAAKAIGKVAGVLRPDWSRLGDEAAKAGALAIPLVKELGAKVAASDPAAAGYVHFGSTSQDLFDTAMVLQLRQACALLRRDLERLTRALAALADGQRATVMLARTLMQPALPTSFGLKAASWLVSIEHARARLEREAKHGLTLQFGGAAGTLAAFGERGRAVSERLARRLDLPLPPLPWHTRRDGIVGLAAAVGILVGALGKIGRDLALMSQAELGEVAEPTKPGRGGSSTLPHKRNPVGALTALAAATRAPGLVSTLLAAMPQELERALGGWQAEALPLTELFALAHGALVAMADTIEGLELDPAAMRRNLDRLDGLVLAERLMLALAPHTGRNEAHQMVEQLTRRVVAEKRHLRDLALADERVTGHLTPEAVGKLFDPSSYLGSADDFIDAALAAHRQRAVKEES